MGSFSICSLNASKVYLMKKKWCIWQLNKSNLCQWYQVISLEYIKRNGSTFPHIINETHTESKSRLYFNFTKNCQKIWKRQNFPHKNRRRKSSGSSSELILKRNQFLANDNFFQKLHISKKIIINDSFLKFSIKVTGL